MPAAPSETQRHPAAQSGEGEFFRQTSDVHQRQPIAFFITQRNRHILGFISTPLHKGA